MHIMLLGVSRSGKSTLAKLLKEDYQIITGDLIRNSYKKNISNKSTKELKNNKNYRYFIRDIFLNNIKYNSSKYLIDTVDIYPEDLINIDLTNILVIYLGYTKISIDELIDIWQKDKNLKNKPIEYLKEKAIRNIKLSKKYKEQCQKYNFFFIDTSYNQKEIINKIYKEIKNEFK